VIGQIGVDMARQSLVSFFSFSYGASEGYRCERASEGQKAKKASKGAGRCVYTQQNEAEIFGLLYLPHSALLISYSRLNEPVFG